MGTGPSRPKLASRAVTIASLADWQSAFARDLGSAHLVGCQLPRVLYELIASYVVPELDEILSCRKWKWGVARWLDVLYDQTNGRTVPYPDSEEIRSRSYGFEWNQLTAAAAAVEAAGDGSTSLVAWDQFVADVKSKVRTCYSHVALPPGYTPPVIEWSDKIDPNRPARQIDDRPDVNAVFSGIEQFARLFTPPLRILTRSVLREDDVSHSAVRHYWLQPLTDTTALHVVFVETVQFRRRI